MRLADVLTAIEHELNEAADAVMDTDEPARWSLTAWSGTLQFSSVLAVLAHTDRTGSFPRSLKVDFQLGADEGAELGVARLTGVLRRRPLTGVKFQLTSNDDALCTRLATALRPRLHRLTPVDHSPAARPRQVPVRPAVAVAVAEHSSPATAKPSALMPAATIVHTAPAVHTAPTVDDTPIRTPNPTLISTH